MPNEVVKRISVKDQNGQVVPYDVGGDAQNIDYDNSNVKAKLDSLKSAAFKDAGVANGVATLGVDGKVPNSQLPSSQGKNNVVEGYRNPENGLFYSTYESETYSNPIAGEADIIYIDLLTNYTYMYYNSAFVQIGGSDGADNVIEGYYKTADGKFYEESTYETEIAGAADTLYIDLPNNTLYRYNTSTSTFVPVNGGGGGGSLELGTTHQNAYYGDQGDTAYQHSQLTSGNPHHVTAADLDIAVFKCYSKTLDVSEESSVTFTDEDFDEDTVVFGIYTNNGLFYSTIVEDTENHTITITYDTTGISDDFKVIIVFIPGSQIIDMDNSNVEPEP